MNASFTVTVAFRCHFAINNALLTGAFNSHITLAIYPYCGIDSSDILPVSMAVFSWIRNFWEIYQISWLWHLKVLSYKSRETNKILKGPQTMTKGLPQTVTENRIIYRPDNATQTYLPDWELTEQKPMKALSPLLLSAKVTQRYFWQFGKPSIKSPFAAAVPLHPFNAASVIWGGKKAANAARKDSRAVTFVTLSHVTQPPKSVSWRERDKNIGYCRAKTDRNHSE